MSAETDMAKSVVSWLEDQHWDVYQEVLLGNGGPRADIVARQGRLVWVIEAKLSPSLALLNQAYGWVGRAHYVSVATPYRAKPPQSAFTRFLSIHGIGHIISTSQREAAYQALPPRLYRRADIRWDLRTEHKTHAQAGSTGGRYWSPFKATCGDIRHIVASNPGICLGECLRLCHHHYSSYAAARSSIAYWIQAGKVPGVRLEKVERNILLYPQEMPG